MCGEDELFSDSLRDFGLNIAHILILIDHLHAVTCHLADVILIAVLIWELIDLLEDQVVQLHELHSWERFNIHERETSREFQCSLVVHVLLMIKDSVPNGLRSLLVALLLGHGRWVMHVGVAEVGAEAAHGRRQQGRAATGDERCAPRACHQTTSEHIFPIYYYITIGVYYYT